MENEKLNKEGRATIELMVADGIISKECAEKYFPELKESEDEKTRKELIEFVGVNIVSFDERHERWLAWLEKQVEQKPVWSEEDEKYLRDTTSAIFAADYYTCEDKQEIENWLKGLKERYAYKPTDEQIDALRYVVNHYTPAVYDKLAWDALNTTQLMFGQLVKL